jgi:2-hydroxy-3-keto-5-methylthiopentenyl-1-phosphate phosphatase
MTDKFLKKYDNHVFEDWGTSCSDDFKSFVRQFKNYIKRNIPDSYEILKHRCNHYDFSGYVKNPAGKCVYYSYTWNRFSPVRVDDMSFRNNILVRFCEDENDYHGEHNEFTSIAELPQKIKNMLG